MQLFLHFFALAREKPQQLRRRSRQISGARSRVVADRCLQLRRRGADHVAEFSGTIDVLVARSVGPHQRFHCVGGGGSEFGVNLVTRLSHADYFRHVDDALLRATGARLSLRESGRRYELGCRDEQSLRD